MNLIKVYICTGVIILFAFFAQIKFGNNGAWIIGGLLVFGIGFGWYACKAKQDEEISRKSEK